MMMNAPRNNDTINLQALVIEDDFMIARIHERILGQWTVFKKIDIALRAEEAFNKAKIAKPDLLLLDIYLPDMSGIDLLRVFREERIPSDAILITAARESEMIEEAFRLGIFDYLIKPIDFDVLANTIERYINFKMTLLKTESFDQKVIDRLKKMMYSSHHRDNEDKKGIDQRTLMRIESFLSAHPFFWSAEQVARQLGISYSTARTYLDHLVAQGIVEETLRYGKVGRPQRLFKIIVPTKD